MEGGHCFEPRKQNNNNGNKKEKGAPIIDPFNEEVGMLASFFCIFFLLLIFTEKSPVGSC